MFQERPNSKMGDEHPKEQVIEITDPLCRMEN